MNPPIPIPLPPGAAPTPAADTPLPPSSGRRAFPWGFSFRALGLIFLLFVLIGVLFPVFNTVSVGCDKSPLAKALSQAKQIGLALKLYAGEHDGQYPAGTNEYGETIRTSNDAFRSLFPQYVTSEAIFGNKLSAYQTTPPDNVITPFNEALRPGENVYSYVTGEIDGKTSPSAPLVVEGTDGTGRGTYVSDPKARGGTRSGQKAVVIRADNSGTLENLLGPANARYIPTPLPDGTKGNLLSPAALGPGLKLLDPAVAAGASKTR